MNMYDFNRVYDIIDGWCCSQYESEINLIYEVWNERLVVENQYKTSYNIFEKFSLSNLKRLMSMLKNEDGNRALHKVILEYR